MAYYHRGGRFAVGGREGVRGRGRGRASSSADDMDFSNVFRVERPQHYRGAAPVFGKAEVLGGYSVDEDRKFGHDRSMLKFLDRKYLPDNDEMSVKLDLNRGAEKASLYSGNSSQTLQNLLQWIFSNSGVLMTDTTPPRLEADFISIRNTFSTIMRSTYNFREAWIIDAIEFNGSIYMVRRKDETFDVRPGIPLENFEVWGHKFEQYMTGGEPDEGILANEEYRCALRVKVDENSLLFAPEVDCADPCLYEEDFKDLSAFITVKCCKENVDHRKLHSFKRFKLCQWWIENILTGIPRILVGFRNDSGIVHTLKHYETDELPEICDGEWEPDVCINFLVKFLAFVKKKCLEEPECVYRFYREEKGNIYCTKMKDSPDTEVLPSWYIDEMFSEDTENDSESETE